MSLDEATLRTEGFTEGNWFVLADGQRWCFPRPRFRFKPKMIDGKIDVVGQPTYGPEHDDKLDVLFGVTEADALEQWRVKFEMAVLLLQANYNLTVDQIGDLIVFVPGEPASDDRWENLTRAIMGIAPKELTPAGSDSPA